VILNSVLKDTIMPKWYFIAEMMEKLKMLRQPSKFTDFNMCKNYQFSFLLYLKSHHILKKHDDSAKEKKLKTSFSNNWNFRHGYFGTNQGLQSNTT